MPFNPEAIIELRERGGLSPGGLAKLLINYARSYGLKNKKFSKSLVSGWENNNRLSDWDNLELLYIFVIAYNNRDLDFYVKPTKYRIIKK